MGTSPMDQQTKGQRGGGGGGGSLQKVEKTEAGTKTA